MDRITHGKNGKKPYLHIEKKRLGAAHAIHAHDHVEIELILCGRGVEQINGVNHEIKRGVFTLLRPTDFHALLTSEPTELYNLSFVSELLPAAVAQTLYCFDHALTFVFTDEETTELSALFALLLRTQNRHARYDEKIVQNVLETIVLSLLERLPHGTVFEDSDPLLPALRYLHEHYADDPSLDELAKVVHLHPAYFSRLFRKAVGRTFTEYVTDLKIAHAKKLLLSERFSVLDVCFQSGFSSINHFIRTFKKRTGVTPSAFKNAAP